MGLPGSARVPVLAGSADLVVEVFLELQAGIRRVPLQEDRTDMETGKQTVQKCLILVTQTGHQGGETYFPTLLLS